LNIRSNLPTRSVEDELAGGDEVSKTITNIVDLIEKIEHSSLSTSYLNI